MTLKQQLSKVSPLSLALILVFASIMTYAIVRSFANPADSATLYTSPGGSQSATLNGTFAVTVRINASAAVGAAEVDMSYPADKLQVQSINYSGSPYELAAYENNSGGVIQMDRATTVDGGVSAGDKLYAQISFKAVAAGSATINFNGSSVVRSNSDITPMTLSRNGVTYNIEAPAAPATPPVSGGGGTGTNPAGGVPAGQGASNVVGTGSNTASGGNKSSGGTGSSGSQSSGSANSQNAGEANGANDEADSVPSGDTATGNSPEKQKSDSKTPIFTSLAKQDKLNPQLAIGLPLAAVALIAAIIFSRPWLIQKFAGHNKPQTTPVTPGKPDVPKTPVTDSPGAANVPQPGATVTPEKTTTSNDNSE